MLRIPDYFESPVMILDSLSRKDSVVVVTDMLDTDGLPIIASIKPNGEGYFDAEVVPSNFMRSVYGRNEFADFIQRAIDNDAVLYTDKVKSQKLYQQLRVQFPQGLTTLGFDTIIHKSRNIVKGNKDIQYSDRDSSGRQLTEEQQEYFAESKVRDDNGNLLVVYHGTRSADFTVFKRNLIFFTDSEEMADSYAPNGDKFARYLNITNPFVIDAQGEKWSRIPIDDEMRRLLKEYGGSSFKEDGKWRSTPADIAYTIQDAVDEGESDYDGVIVKNVGDTGSYWKNNNEVISNDYIAFRSNQFKKLDNTTPTDNADIRFSDRDNVSIYDVMGETESLKKQHALLKADIESLKERLKLERQG